MCLILITQGYGFSRYFFITAKDGIKLYEEPSFSSKQSITLPYNTPVELGCVSEVIIDGEKLTWIEVIRNDTKGWALFRDISSEYDSAPFLKQVTVIKKLFADAQDGNSHLNRNLKLNMTEKEIIGILGDRKKITSDQWGFIYLYDKLQIYFADSDHGFFTIRAFRCSRFQLRNTLYSLTISKQFLEYRVNLFLTGHAKSTRFATKQAIMQSYLSTAWVMRRLRDV
ncbi:MAG: SH3 domain-containing protein [Spirochaetes bacterium]|nr:SH3 domain-containing protein [Spirochaetota bacterium]